MSYGVAVIGTGYMARKHCDALAGRPEVRLIAVCSTQRSHGAATEVAAQHGFARATSDYASTLADPDVDVVFVCSPDSAHAEQVSAALEAGKHVFCEKPLARTEQEFEQIHEKLVHSDRVLQVGMNCRFRRQYARAQELAAAEELGGLRFIRGTYVVNVVGSVRAGEKPWWRDYPSGIFPFLHGGGIHMLDLLRWIGGEVTSVFARATSFELATEWGADTFSASLEFASGATGELLVSASAHRPNDISLELWFSEGSLLGTTIFRRADEDQALESCELDHEQTALDLHLQFDDLASAIQLDRRPLNSFDEAWANWRVTDAIERSIASGRQIPVSNQTMRGGN